MTITMAKDERINLRVSSERKALYAQVAQSQGISVTEFILNTVDREAQDRILDRSIFVLDPEEFDQLVEKLSDVEANQARLQKLREIARPWEV
jgi:uncharacterized protein (DUF1778 family)